MGNDVVLVGPHPDSGYRHYLVACCCRQKIINYSLSVTVSTTPKFLAL